MSADQTNAPWLYCDMAARRGLEPLARAELRGAVVFCRYCQGTLHAGHHRVYRRV